MSCIRFCSGNVVINFLKLISIMVSGSWCFRSRGAGHVAGSANLLITSVLPLYFICFSWPCDLDQHILSSHPWLYVGYVDLGSFYILLFVHYFNQGFNPFTLKAYHLLCKRTVMSCTTESIFVHGYKHMGFSYIDN